NTANQYSYDLNGNMTADTNKNITAITYNHLNLPTQITFATTGNIVYIYNAAGQKIQKIVNETGRTAIKTDYLGGYQYDNSVLKFFPTAEGYIEPSAGSYKYIYQYKDHLGNVRLSYDKTLAIKEENNYYPFGLKHEGYNTVKSGIENKYKYNGKELQDELGLNMYDYGARNYDPALGRWMNIDILAEQYMNLGGYVYCLNNPIRFIDPTGMAVEEIEGGIRYTEEDAVSAWKVLTGKSKNALVEVVGDEKDRAGINNKDKQTVHGAWSVFAVSNLGLGAKVLESFKNFSLDNLIVSNHGGYTDENNYFQYNSKDVPLTSENSITTSEIASYNSKKGVNLTDGEKQVLAFLQMGNKVKNDENFIFAFCSTGKGDVGKQTLSELKALLGDRLRLYIPTDKVAIYHQTWATGPGVVTDASLNANSKGWLRSMPGVQDSSTVKNISISSNASNPVNIKR
ncbi:RHS repeat domain-containing protein, partial [Flavobacterium collinsii]|uniref:RHS repeat domain-containing protein n=1 Tax=Flavobacterium collinsii TaxID=1114861 RepID=UPI002490B24C